MTQTEFDKLQKRKDEIEALDLRKTMRMPRAMSLFFTVQFVIGYYSIFHVSWLGWDLVEPLTFTVG